MTRVSLPTRLDPRFMTKARASGFTGLAVAALTAVGVLIPSRAGAAAAGAGAAFIGVAALSWLLLARAEAHDAEARALWSLGALVSDGRPWPTPGGWALGADAALVLVTEVMRRGLTTVVELGPGFSSVVLGRGGLGRLELYGIEHDPHFAARVRWDIEQHAIVNYALFDAPLKVQMVDGRSVRWYDQEAIEKLPAQIDVLVIDGPPAEKGAATRAPAWPILRSRMRQGGLVLIDDAHRTDEREMVRAWVADGGLRVLRDCRSFILLEVA